MDHLQAIPRPKLDVEPSFADLQRQTPKSEPGVTDPAMQKRPISTPLFPSRRFLTVTAVHIATRPEVQPFIEWHV